MFWFLVIVVLLALAAYKFRVPILAKLMGQSEARVQRALERRKRR